VTKEVEEQKTDIVKFLDFVKLISKFEEKFILLIKDFEIEHETHETSYCLL